MQQAEEEVEKKVRNSVREKQIDQRNKGNGRDKTLKGRERWEEAVKKGQLI